MKAEKEEVKARLSLPLLVAGVFAANVAYTFAGDVLAVFAAALDGRGDFHGGVLSGLGRRCHGARSGRWCELSVSGETSVISAEAIDDPPLLQIVGSHLYLHAITGKDANFVHPHTSG
jgi:hypothetical protein